MHEHSFVKAIISPVKNKKNVRGIKIEVGELAGIEPSHLKEHLFDETKWEIQTIEKSSKVKCSCGYIGKARIKEKLHDLILFDCPNCGKIPEILEGKDIKILKIIYN